SAAGARVDGCARRANRHHESGKRLRLPAGDRAAVERRCAGAENWTCNSAPRKLRENDRSQPEARAGGQRAGGHGPAARRLGLLGRENGGPGVRGFAANSSAGFGATRASAFAANLGRLFVAEKGVELVQYDGAEFIANSTAELVAGR